MAHRYLSRLPTNIIHIGMLSTDVLMSMSAGDDSIGAAVWNFHVSEPVSMSKV